MYPLAAFWPYEITTTAVTDFVKDPVLPKTYKTLCTAEGCFLLSDDNVERIPIPKVYKNGLRLLNAKVSFLHNCISVLSDPTNVTDGAEQNLRLALVQVVKHLTFHINVRDAFIAQLPKVPNSGNELENFQSDLLEAWLFCEFQYGVHDPAQVNGESGESDWKLPSGSMHHLYFIHVQ